jgi:hypothetical protein
MNARVYQPPIFRTAGRIGESRSQPSRFDQAVEQLLGLIGVKGLAKGLAPNLFPRNPMCAAPECIAALAALTIHSAEVPRAHAARNICAKAG